MAEKKKRGLIARSASALRAFFGPETEHIQSVQSDSYGQLSLALTQLGAHVDRLMDDEDKNKLLPRLPSDPLTRYMEYDRMAEDPICGRALTLHVDNALTYDEDTGNSVYIESRNDEQNPVVADLRSVFHEWQQKYAKIIASNLAKYGCWGIRPYFIIKNGKYVGMDMERTEAGMEGHPSKWRHFYSRGQYLGVWSEFQDPNKPPMLSEPWQFTVFKSSAHMLRTGTVINRVHPTDPGYIFDIWDEEPPATLSENPDYGHSLFAPAYTPWKGIEEACLAMLLARLKTANRETLISYPISNQDPVQASRMIQNLTDTLQGKEDEEAKRTLKEGLVRVSKKLIIPYDATGKGQVGFVQNEGNINITAIEDLMFYVKVVCGALAIDPSLVGFSDMLSGGLGEGGWLRLSVLAVAYSIALRQSLTNGFEEMYKTQAYLRWGKVFTPNNKPWRTKYHAASSGRELEMGAVQLQRMDLAERLAGLMSTFESEEGGTVSEFKKALLNVLLSNTLKMEEPIVNELIGLLGKPDERTEEKGEKFFDMKEEEKKDFVEEQVNKFFMGNFNV